METKEIIEELKGAFISKEEAQAIVDKLADIFQFLIGRVQTFVFLLVYSIFTSFQFLIGRVQTPSIHNFEPKTISISIPYR